MPAPASPTKVVRSADGLEIYAEAAGDPSKPHVVFIHGFTLSSIVWDAQFSDARLLDHIFAVRYDLRGHGRTGRPVQPEAWTSQRIAEDFDAVVKAFNLKKPILVGWSYGATVAADLVNAFGTHYLSSIIYTGALGYTPDKDNFLSPQSDISLRFQDQSLTPNENHQLLVGFLEACCADTQLVPLETRQSWLEVMVAQPLAMRKLAASRTQDKKRFWIEAGPVLPLLVIHGKLDGLCPWDAIVEEVQERFRNAEIMSLSGVGHAPFVERVIEFNDAIIRWVRKHTVSRG